MNVDPSIDQSQKHAIDVENEMKHTLRNDLSLRESDQIAECVIEGGLCSRNVPFVRSAKRSEEQLFRPGPVF